MDFIAFSAERGKQWQPDQGPRAPGSRVEPGLGQGRGKMGAWGISQPKETGSAETQKPKSRRGRDGREPGGRAPRGHRRAA